MPIINGVKYACEPCMRGHRSSKCTHEDRLLVRVRKPGRPLSSCPHLPPGAGGTTTFVDANGERLDDTTPTHGHGAGGKPCGCEITSLAIPKVAACACSIPQVSHPSSPGTTPTSKSSSFELRIYPHQLSKTRVSSPPTSPISPVSVYSATSESGSGRISKSSKKRKSISVSGETLLDIASREALFEIAAQSAVIGTERTTEPSAGLDYDGEVIHLTNAQLSNGRAALHAGHESGISQFQINETARAQDSSNAIFNNAAFWGQESWRSVPTVHLPRESEAQQVASQEPKSCCNGCGTKSAKLAPTVAHNQLMNQAPFQTPSPFNLPQPPPFLPMFHEPMQDMQPVATTIYTYPNGYTTVNNPLTPQELRMLQATGAWSSGASAAWSGHGVGAAANGMDAEYACSCGPGCECLGCAAHPFNSSTVNFVKDMRTMMHSGRHGVPPRRLKVVPESQAAIRGVGQQTSGCCGGVVQQRNNIVLANTSSHSDSNPNSQSNSMNYGVVQNQQNLEPMSSHNHHISPSHPPPHHHHHHHHHHHRHKHAPSPHPLQQVQNIGSPQSHHIPISSSPSSQHNASPLNSISPTPQRPHHCRPVLAPSASSPVYTAGSSPDAANGEDDTEAEQNSVSPSAYFHIDYPLGVCCESDMGCLCGDDCACIGCMIHGNNMPDIASTLNEPIESEALTTQGLDNESVSNPSGGCCGRGGRINSENGIETGRGGNTQGRGLLNGTLINNQEIDGQGPPNIHERPRQPLLEGMHDHETLDGQRVYAWA